MNTDEFAPWVEKYGLLQPYGMCQCGCGQVAPLAGRSRGRGGWLKGHPKRFINGHNTMLPTLADAFNVYFIAGDPNSCWEWNGTRNDRGYGKLYYRNRQYRAHRVSYELHHGSIPDGVDICHKCDNPPCVNPNHLFVGTRQVNVNDMVAKGRDLHGERAHHAKLREQDIIEIRALCAAGIPQKEVAERFGVIRRTISFVVSRQTWRHVNEPT